MPKTAVQTSAINPTSPIRNCVELHKIPSQAFTGLLLNPSVEKLKLPILLKYVAGEIYSIKLFDKTKKIPVDGFLGYRDIRSTDGISDSDKLLSIYNAEGNSIGRVGLDLLNMHEHTYTRLHYLESTDNNIAGVGSKLIQAAVEKSLETPNAGKIYVIASNFQNYENDPFIFYNKMGLSIIGNNENVDKNFVVHECLKNAADKLNLSKDDFVTKIKGPKSYDEMDADEQLVSFYETVAREMNCKTNAISLNLGDYMYLHDNKVNELWLPKIKSNPIFNESNRLK